MIALQDFITEHTGKTVSFLNCENNQCMTLMHCYNQEVLGITDPTVLAQPFAYQVYANFPNVAGHGLFALVANTPTNVPTSGDIIVFKQSAETPDGHVCIFVSGDVMQFTSFDCNYPTGSLPHLQLHQYTNVAGWLHPLSLPQTETMTVPNIQQTEDALRQDRDRWWNALSDVCAAFGITPDPANIDTTVQQVKDKVKSYQDNLASLTSSNNDLQKKYDSENAEVILLNDSLEKITTSNKEYATEAHDAQNKLKDMTDNLHAVSDSLNVPRTATTDDRQLAEECLAEVHRLQQTNKQIPIESANSLVGIASLLQKYGLNDFLQKNGVEVVDLLHNATDPHLGDKITAFITSIMPELEKLNSQPSEAKSQTLQTTSPSLNSVKSQFSQATEQVLSQLKQNKKTSLIQSILSIGAKIGVLQAV